jgi:hypothetical protein
MLNQLTIKTDELNKKIKENEKLLSDCSIERIKAESIRLDVASREKKLAKEKEEFEKVCYKNSEIKIQSLTSEVVQYKSPNGNYFTVKDMIEVIEKLEMLTRKNSIWLGGIDLHHIYFEGMIEEKDNVFKIQWGS